MTYHVFYHYPCNDGELSRVIWEYFEPFSIFYKWFHNNTNHEDDINIINNLPDKSNIVFLDLTPITIIDKLSNTHNYIIIDHHKNPILSLIEKKATLPDYNILLYTQNGFPEENNLSGCKLTWLYFKKFYNDYEIKDKEDYPSVVYYIGNKDVWDFSDPNTESYCLGLNSYIKNNQDYDENCRLNFLKDLLKNDDNDEKIINIGSTLISSYKEQAKDIFKNYSFDTFDKLNIIDINCSNTSLYKYLIEFAEENFDEQEVLRILHSETDTQKIYSLRSLKDHVKVDEMARFYGGNGHEKASGYSINIF